MRGLKVLCALIGLISSTAMAGPHKITLATSAWEPYVSDDPAYHGYVYEIVKSAFEASGYTVEIKFMSWHNATRAVELGLVDGIFPEYTSEERSNVMEYSKPFSASPIGLYKLNNNDAQFPNRTPLKDLEKTFDQMKHYRFGAVKGYINVPAFDNNPHLKKHFVNNDKENIEQLYNGKVDIIIIDKYTANYLLKNEFPWNYQIKMSFMKPALGHKNCHVAIPKKIRHHKQLLEAFNKGLVTIRHNGLLGEIIDRDAAMNGEDVA